MDSGHPPAPQRATPPAPGFHLGRCLASLYSVAPSVQRVFSQTQVQLGPFPFVASRPPIKSGPCGSAPTAHKLCPPPSAAWAFGSSQTWGPDVGPSDSHCSFCLEHDPAISALPSGRFLLARAWLRRPLSQAPEGWRPGQPPLHAPLGPSWSVAAPLLGPSFPGPAWTHPKPRPRPAPGAELRGVWLVTP